MDGGDGTFNQHDHVQATPTGVSYLYGVAVDGLSSARHVHRLGDLQDVVGYIARCPTAVTNLPPLLPVVQNLATGSIRIQ